MKALMKLISSKAEMGEERGAKKRVLSRPSSKVAPFTVARPNRKGI